MLGLRIAELFNELVPLLGTTVTLQCVSFLGILTSQLKLQTSDPIRCAGPTASCAAGGRTQSLK